MRTTVGLLITDQSFCLGSDLFYLVAITEAVLTVGLIPIGGPEYPESPLMITTRENAVVKKLSIYVSLLLYLT